MITRTNFISIIILIYFTNATSLAHEPKPGDLWAAFGPFIYQTQSSMGPAYTPVMVGAGVIAEGDVSHRGGLEAGLFYTSKTYQRNIQNVIIAERVHKISLPLGYRDWITDRVSLGLFFDTQFSNGDTQLVYQSAPTIESTTAREPVEYGLDFSIQWQIWDIGDVSILLDGRYFWSFAGRTNEDNNQYALLLGIKHFIKKLGE